MGSTPLRLLVLYDFAVDDHPFTRALRARFAGEVVERGVPYRAGHRIGDKLAQKGAVLRAAATALPNLDQFDAILCWQQDMGLMLGGMARARRSHGRGRLCVLMFIAPERRRHGMLRRAIAWALGAPQVAHVVCYGEGERDLYRRSFPEVAGKFAHLLLSEEYPGIERFPVTQGDAFVAAGRSNRDYRFLLDYFAARPHLRLEIVNDDPALTTALPNVTIHRNVYRDDYMRLMARARAVIIPFDDPKISAGQLVFLHALQLGKPAVCTQSACLAGYLENGVNGLAIEKTVAALDGAVATLAEPGRAAHMSDIARADYRARFSFERQASDVLALMALPVRAVFA